MDLQGKPWKRGNHGETELGVGLDVELGDSVVVAAERVSSGVLRGTMIGACG